MQIDVQADALCGGDVIFNTAWSNEEIPVGFLIDVIFTGFSIF